MAVAGPESEGAEGIRRVRPGGASERRRPASARDVVPGPLHVPAVDGARRRLDERQRERSAQASQSDLRLTYLISIRSPLVLRPSVGLRAAGGTAIGIRFGVVGERFMADAILRFEPRGSLGLRNVGNDPIILAGLERVAVVVAGVGEGCQRLDAKFVLRSLAMS